MLNYYDELFCQYVGGYGFTPLEAYCKARNIQTIEVDDNIRSKCKSLMKRKEIKDKISEYNRAVQDKAIAQAQDAAAYNKADAMRDLQFVMAKCRDALDIQTFSDSQINLVKEALVKGFSDKVDKNGRYPEEIYYLLTVVPNHMAKPIMNTKAGELLTKNIRLAGELYDLLNTDVHLKVDNDAAKLLAKLEENSLESLLKVAYGGSDVGQTIITYGTSNKTNC